MEKTKRLCQCVISIVVLSLATCGGVCVILLLLLIKPIEKAESYS